MNKSENAANIIIVFQNAVEHVNGTCSQFRWIKFTFVQFIVLFFVLSKNASRYRNFNRNAWVFWVNQSMFDKWKMTQYIEDKVFLIDNSKKHKIRMSDGAWT